MAKSITILDGGFSTQLAEYVGLNVDGDPLWSAKFNYTDPQAIVKSHIDFLRSGATIILTNTYQASVEGYMKYLKLSKEDSIQLIKDTVRLAHESRDTFLRENNNNTEEIPKIFGSIGPYGAHLHNGSEYTGSYADTVSPDEIKKWHKVRLDAVLEAGVDGLAVETIPCEMEALAVVDLILENYPNTKFWISFQAKVDGRAIAHGEDFAETAEKIWNKVKSQKSQNLLAVGVNCICPQYVGSLFERLNGDREESDRIPLVVYPNSGEKYTIEDGWHGKNECVPLEDYVEEWVRLGAIYIGGCCRTNAKDIVKIKKKVDSLKL